MEDPHQKLDANGLAENGPDIMRHSPYQAFINVSLPWLDLRIFYVRLSKCEMDDSTPQYLTLNNITLNRGTLLEVNGSVYSDGVSTLLRRDRLDKKSEEVTFVSTGSIRMTGSVKFEVFDEDVLVLSGVLELCNSNGFVGESNNHGNRWCMKCESDMPAGTGFLKGKQYLGLELASPAIEVYVAGCFLGNPIVLTETLQLSFRKKQMTKGMLESIPEYEGTENQKDVPCGFALQVAYPNYKPEYGELSWFNAGVRVGVGIGLSICLGIGIGVGLLFRTYQGTNRNFIRRLL